MSPSKQAIFWCIVPEPSQKPYIVNTNNKFSFHTVYVFHALYIVQLSDKYENLSKEMCWNDAYLILGL